jgi:hypothetical protein
MNRTELRVVAIALRGSEVEKRYGGGSLAALVRNADNQGPSAR